MPTKVCQQNKVDTGCLAQGLLVAFFREVHELERYFRAEVGEVFRDRNIPSNTDLTVARSLQRLLGHEWGLMDTEVMKGTWVFWEYCQKIEPITSEGKPAETRI